MAPVAMAVHQTRQHGMALAVHDSSSLRLGRQLFHWPHSDDTITLYRHITLVIDSALFVDGDNNPVFQQ